MSAKPNEMVRVYYIGEPGALNHPRLPGLNPEYGHAVDVPALLAVELEALGLFTTGLFVQVPAEEWGEPMKPMTEIVDALPPAAEPPWKALVELDAGGDVDGFERTTPLEPGDFVGMGEVKTRQMIKMGIASWQALAALPDAACEAIAGELSGVSTSQMEEWRDAARNRLDRDRHT